MGKMCKLLGGVSAAAGVAALTSPAYAAGLDAVLMPQTGDTHDNLGLILACAGAAVVIAAVLIVLAVRRKKEAAASDSKEETQ
ncbi:LPXTG cell wall anchor domain-containing protein [Christensenellaceae bacterium NSJ-44]|uniref:LPXTG cell wall anchor domain-containing protein n=2 Tax=Luoshenia tenuis TaxID=2763654 RepID=A0A926D411_9FIRM|nr:LPXTG cell wall anchor domain-containing protein [Luoshenia tenuis]